MPMVLLGGFFSNANNMGWWIIWMSYFSPIKYGFEMMVRTQTNYNKPLNTVVTKFLGMNIGFWNDVIIMIALCLLLRMVGVGCLKILISKFQ